MLAGSMAAGYVLSRLVSQRQPGSRAPDRSFVEAFPPNGRLRDLHHARTDFTPPPPVAKHQLPKHSVFNELTEKFAPEISKVSRSAP
jgi:hypothetical protein